MMINIQAIPLDKEVYCFELDDVLYPKQDYLLQVYYLFAQFIEFTEGSPHASELTAFMKNTYLHQGEDAMFSLVQQTFGLDEKYKENLERLKVNAHLPLKLLLFKEVEDFLNLLFAKEKKITILTGGNPVEQLNKLKHVDWGTLESHKNSLRVYFIDELVYRNYEPIKFIANEFGIDTKEIHLIQKW
ncbi:HAD family hydrolase [Parapedobacter sp. SGR-10]|uniref:HAD family hydrolase n=1 Tax=Parapedobacter sp. SGR-10 TaxID=2710879 RepID=UPI001F0D615B|nr:HAD family hydrolase [Parapedobacter sp. SGR-10]